MDDLISRQAAIDLWEKYHPTIAVDAMQYDAELRQLPSAQPKTGRWIIDRSGAYCCSKCMEPCATYVMMKPRDKFCKMCGSRNEVTE